jgi:hypothetical protein
MFFYFVISLICVGVVYFSMLYGGAASTLHLHPLEFLHFTVFEPPGSVNSVARLGLLACAAMAACFCVFVPLLGAAGLWRRRGRHLPTRGFLAAVFLVSVAIYLLAAAPGDGQLYIMV